MKKMNAMTFPVYDPQTGRFIDYLMETYNVSEADRDICVRENSGRIDSMTDIFSFGNDREKQLCADLLSIISLGQNGEILNYFYRENNPPGHEAFSPENADREIDRQDLVLIISALSVNEEFFVMACNLCGIIRLRVEEINMLKTELDHSVALHKIPFFMWDKEMVLCQLACSADALVFVREHRKDLYSKDVWLKAINNGPHALLYIDEKEWTEDMCLEAVRKRDKYKYAGLLLKTIKERKKELCTGRICLAAVESNGRALQYVPEDIIGTDPAGYYRTAVESWGGALELVPEEYQTGELYKLAVRNFYGALAWVKGGITDVIAIEALKNNPDAINFLPEKLRRKKQVQKAFKASLKEFEKKTAKKDEAYVAKLPPRFEIEITTSEETVYKKEGEKETYTVPAVA
ncbi:MAG: hypothetical protein LBI86_00990 [Treponema sp.]|jgi:hypothetical protein|nr:hypothetical protein [Treponema sp.]